jgi:esterase/lipase
VHISVRLWRAGLLLLPLACSSPQLGPSPIAASAGYAEAVALVTSRQARDDSVVAPDYRSILMTHGQRAPRVFLLLHGFTDAPPQFKAVGQRLFDGGANVYIPRLPHHAERQAPIRALARVSAAELARFGDSVVAESRGLGDTIVIVGLSAGGTIAAHVVQTNPEVGRVVLIAPAIAAALVSDSLERELVELAQRLPDIRHTNAPVDSTHPDFVQGFTTRGLAELLQLGAEVRDDAQRYPPRVKSVTFLLNEQDHTVSEEASLDLAQRWFDRGANVAAFRFPGSLKLPHNVMEELPKRGGKTAVVYPVVEALALGNEPPSTVRKLDQPCGGFRCALRRWFSSKKL